MVHDEPGTPSTGAALDLLLTVTALLSDDMAHDLAGRGLTRARATALWEVARHGPLAQRVIADLLGVTPRNVTKLIDGLEHDGFVVRTANAADRRSVLVRLTPKGEQTTTALRSEAEVLAADLFGGLPPDELATFTRVLDGVAASIAAPPERRPGRD